MKPIVAVVDYGMGNLRSVGKALELAGARVRVTSDKKVIRSSRAVVVPGVGSFGPAVKYLKSEGLDKTVIEEVASGKPYLGLCLGFQFLFDESEEEGRYPGFGLIKGKVRKFDFSAKPALKNKLKIPHMGWNRLKMKPGSEKMFKGIPDGSFFYFVHSYYADPVSGRSTAATAGYGIEFCAAVIKENIWACQFHPEKSGEIGIRMLRNFVNGLK